MSVAKCVRTVAAVLGVLLVAKAANAADPYSYGGYKDQPAPQAIPAPFWQGFYAGGNVGGLWSTIDAAYNIYADCHRAAQSKRQCFGPVGRCSGRVQL